MALKDVVAKSKGHAKQQAELGQAFPNL